MVIRLEDRLPLDYKGFLFRKSTSSLIINSSDFKKAIEIMRDDNINHLEINSNFFYGKELNFLHEFKFIDKLTIIGSLIEDVTPVQELINLKSLVIESKLNGDLNFEIFKKLEDCFFVWGLGRSQSIFKVSSLVNLRIDNFDKYDFYDFSILKKMLSLSLCNAKVVNLNGIKLLKSLTKLELISCDELQNIEEIIELENLQELRLDNCKRLTTIEPVKHLNKLRSLSFNNLGNLTSIKYLKSLSHLEEVFFSDNTNILDGDINSLFDLYKNEKLKRAIFKSRKHYTHKPQDLGFNVPDVVSNIFKKK